MRKSVYSPETAILGRTLADERKKAGLQQQELAARLEIDQAAISNIERGQRRVDVVEFYMIIREIGADPVAVFTELAHEWDRV